jgi:thiosulfate reductase cytochrome b subunit
MGGRAQPTDRLSKVLKEIIPVITEINSQFKAIDMEIENQANEPSGAIKSRPLHLVFKNIQNVREIMKNDYQNALSLEPYLDDKESIEIKNFLTVVRESLLDSLVLRSLQAVILRMKEIKSALDAYSFVNIENFNEAEAKRMISEGNKRYAALYHCKKVAQNIKRFSSEFRNITIGMTSASCSAVHFAINSVLEQAQLWYGVNSLSAELSKTLKGEIKYKIFNNIMEGVWKAYENISKSNLDRIYAENQFKDTSFKNFEMYINHILTLSRNLRDRSVKEMQKIKEENEAFFSKHMKAVYNIITENIELREMLSECTKNLILKDLSLEGVLDMDD